MELEGTVDWGEFSEFIAILVALSDKRNKGSVCEGR